MADRDAARGFFKSRKKVLWSMAGRAVCGICGLRGIGELLKMRLAPLSLFVIM